MRHWQEELLRLTQLLEAHRRCMLKCGQNSLQWLSSYMKPENPTNASALIICRSFYWLFPDIRFPSWETYIGISYQRLCFLKALSFIYCLSSNHVYIQTYMNIFLYHFPYFHKYLWKYFLLPKTEDNLSNPLTNQMSSFVLFCLFCKPTPPFSFFFFF